MAKKKKIQNGSNSHEKTEEFSKAIKEDMALIDKFFKKIKNVPNYDWKNCSFSGLKERFFVDTSVILHLLGRINEDRCYTIEEVISKRLAVIYWHDKLLGNNDLNSSNRIVFLKAQERELIFVTKRYICSDENVDLEALLKIQKEIAELEPDNGKNFVSIADTCIKLKRYSGSSDSN